MRGGSGILTRNNFAGRANTGWAQLFSKKTTKLNSNKTALMKYNLKFNAI